VAIPEHFEASKEVEYEEYDDYYFDEEEEPMPEMPPPGGDRPPPGADGAAGGYMNLPEGQLICVHKPSKTVEEFPEEEEQKGGGGGGFGFGGGLLESNRFMNEVFDNKQKKPHAIGCCPRGDPNGAVFRDGSSCCVDQIFNTSTHMCCPQKKKVLVYSKESLNYCYGSTCRIDDLELESKLPMESSCTFDKLESPIRCMFFCPAGSQLRGTKLTKCTGGKWSAHPQCCEGCPRTLRKDINFVVDLNSDTGVGHQADVRSLIRNLVSYLPVSQNGVRVSVTSFAGEVMRDERSWSLAAHDNHEQLNAAIDDLQDFQIEPLRNAGAALQYVATHAFTAPYGERKHVDDVIVYIATGDPSDSVMEAAKLLKDKSNFIVMSLGSDITLDLFKSIPADSRLHIEKFANTILYSKHLYENLCGSNCLTS